MSLSQIAIIEDQSLLRDLLHDVLHQRGPYSVVGTAATIEEGLRLCTEHPVSIIIISWQLPDGTALELIRRLAARINSTRILMLTGNENEGIVRTAAENGVHGFVSKRQPLPIFLEAVAALHTGNCYYCPTSSRMLVDAMKLPPSPSTASLTPREWQILRTLAEGHSTRDIARRLHLSPKTVANHITSLKDKLGIQEPAALVRFALKNGLVEMP